MIGKINGFFACTEFTCNRAGESSRGDSLLLTTKSTGVAGTHLIDLWRKRGYAGSEAT